MSDPSAATFRFHLQPLILAARPAFVLSYLSAEQTQVVRCALQAEMEVLQTPLLDKILGNLGRCKDLMQCSAVSKSWRKAADGIRPTTLHLLNTFHRKSNITQNEVIHTMQWLHQKQSSGYFEHLEEFELDVPPPDGKHMPAACYEGDLLSAFWHSSLVFVSFWHLQVLELGGPMHMGSTLPVLPDTLSQLTLRPHAKHMPKNFSLAVFRRFLRLTYLQVGTYDSTPDKHAKGSFVLDTSLPTLKTLSLDPWPLEAHKDHTFVQSLPKVQQLTAHIASNKAQSLVLLPSLLFLGLVLQDIPKPKWGKTPSMQVPSGASLRGLLLVGPQTNPFRLDLSDRSTDLRVAHYHRYDAQGKGNCFLLGQPSVYCSQDHYNMLTLYFDNDDYWP